MNKADFVKKYGGEAYKKRLEQVEVAVSKYKQKGSKGYRKAITYQMNGLPHAKRLIRLIHAQKWRPYKQLIAPESQLHHEWIPGTADYRGVALVETDNHTHGFIDVIQILEGEITLLTEAEIRGDKY